MAYRRRQGMTRAATINQPIYHPPPDDDDDDDGYNKDKKDAFSPPLSSPSAHHRRISSAVNGFPFARRSSSFSNAMGSDDYKYGIWGVLAGKSKPLLDDNQKPFHVSVTPTSTADQLYKPDNPAALVSGQGMDNARLRKGLDAFTSSLNQIGDTIGNAFEERRRVVENTTSNIIQDTPKLQIRTHRNNGSDGPRMPMKPTEPAALSNPETQLKASRDVAMATAAKAKLLLRELKTAKAEIAFARERCTQLEEENKQLRDSRVKGDNNQTDDDMIRLQLEILLAEKARLAHENSILARENRFLREIVEYHQLTMQDLLYVDEVGEDQVTLTEDSLSQPTSPGDPKECDEAPYEEPPDGDGEAEADSKPAIQAAEEDS